MSSKQKSWNILLVEDNPADILLIRKALENKEIRFSLVSFNDGEDALKRLAQQGELLPDLILLDLHLPTLQGSDVLKGMRSIPRLADVPIVVLSSSGLPSDQQQVELPGLARYIRKSMALEDFLKEVGDCAEEILGSA